MSTPSIVLWDCSLELSTEAADSACRRTPETHRRASRTRAGTRLFPPIFIQLKLAALYARNPNHDEVSFAVCDGWDLIWRVVMSAEVVVVRSPGLPV